METTCNSAEGLFCHYKQTVELNYFLSFNTQSLKSKGQVIMFSM